MKVFTDEHRKNLSKAATGRILSEETKAKISKTKTGGKLTEEHKKKISDALKGKYVGVDSSMYGRKHSEETIKKMSESRMGRVITEETRRKIGDANRGKKRSDELKRRISETLTGRKVLESTRLLMSSQRKGKLHWNWQGGLTEKNYRLRNQLYFELNRWRIQVFERDNYTCQICHDSTGGNLNAHHIKSFITIVRENNLSTKDESLECSELWDTNNGITLCIDCHHWVHRLNPLNQQ